MMQPLLGRMLGITLVFSVSLVVQGRAGFANEALTFEEHIRPILRAHCFDCHGATDEKQGELDLRLVRWMQQGGSSGPAIVPGKPGESFLLERLRAGEMPPGEAKVPAAEIELLERWIAEGAVTKKPEPESIGPGVGISEQERAWWSFQPLVRPRVPSIPGATGVQAIDAFLQAAMPSGLKFSPRADKAVLIERATFDLLGLPPQPAEVAAFVADEAPDAYARLIDRLLASPHYGERWARHWLDVAGYADSEGGSIADAMRPWAYKYRDYVIRSLNEDKPFDRFLQEQLAGDELAGPLQGDLTAAQIELLTATGFLRMAADGTGSGENTPEARNQVIADTIKIVTSSLLGMTVACAQCHDHRYDPISHRDYFAIRAVFEPALDWQNWKTPGERVVSLYTAANRQQAAEIETEVQTIAAERQQLETKYIAEALAQEIAKLPDEVRPQIQAALDAPTDTRTDEQKKLLEGYPNLNISPGVLYQYNQGAADELKKFDQRMGEVRARKPVEEFLAVLSEPAGHAPETRRFHRGDYRQPQELVSAGTLEIVSSSEAQQKIAGGTSGLATTGRRLAWARWLTSAENLLTPRVIANRVWLHHFGTGLVGTPADFGRLGYQPTNPELLDWLASELVEHGWSLKHLHRQIMLSQAYQQSSQREGATAELDPDNRYYSRQNVVRLDAETLRDRVLATAGTLDPTMYGAPVPVKADETGQVVVDGPDRRRSLYITQRRSTPVALMQAFDAPVMQTNCELRPSSTVATQSLMLINGPFLIDHSVRVAERILSEQPPASRQGAPIVASIAPVWEYGYGALDEGGQHVAQFTPLPHWTGSSWQGGANLPDAATGWVSLHAQGGHPGENPNFCPIRRFRVPAAMQLSLHATLSHGSENGDGVRGRVVSSRHGLLGSWEIKNGQATTEVAACAVEAGDTIDLVVDAREHVTSDSFQWNVEFVAVADTNGNAPRWSSVQGFGGPQPPAGAGLWADHVDLAWRLCYLRPPQEQELAAATQFLSDQRSNLIAHPEQIPAGRPAEVQLLAHLCHVLLSSNEFMYVE
jgi:hypothetical protein